MLFLPFHVADCRCDVRSAEAEDTVTVLPAKRGILSQPRTKRLRADTFELLHDRGGREFGRNPRYKMNVIFHAAEGKNPDTHLAGLGFQESVKVAFPLWPNQRRTLCGRPDEVKNDVGFCTLHTPYNG